MSADSAGVVRQKNRRKSKQANGSALLPGVDGRSAWVRRAKELISDHTSDLGGIDNVSAAERSIVRRACVLTVELERYEKRFALAERQALRTSTSTRVWLAISAGC